jgi:hypothetical protein
MSARRQRRTSEYQEAILRILAEEEAKERDAHRKHPTLNTPADHPTT